MKRLLCWLLGHRLPAGVTRARSIYFCCSRCNVLVAGELALSNRRKS